MLTVDDDTLGLSGQRFFPTSVQRSDPSVKPATKAMPVAHQALAPAQYTRIQTSPVIAAVATNHSPRMNCLGVTPLVMSM